jgi:hypothetical protein
MPEVEKGGRSAMHKAARVCKSLGEHCDKVAAHHDHLKGAHEEMADCFKELHGHLMAHAEGGVNNTDTNTSGNITGSGDHPADKSLASVLGKIVERLDSIQEAQDGLLDKTVQAVTSGLIGSEEPQSRPNSAALRGSAADQAVANLKLVTKTGDTQAQPTVVDDRATRRAALQKSLDEKPAKREDDPRIVEMAGLLDMTEPPPQVINSFAGRR